MRAVSKTCPITEALVRASFQSGASFRAFVLWIVLRSLLRVSTGLHVPDGQAAGGQQCGNEWGERIDSDGKLPLSQPTSRGANVAVIDCVAVANSNPTIMSITWRGRVELAS